MQLQMKQVLGLLTALKMPFTVQATAPQNPVPNEVWLDAATLSLYAYLESESGFSWIELN
jgi:hypothetical protein